MEAVNGLNIRPDSIYIDGTFGRGGTRAPDPRNWAKRGLLAIDRDPQAIAIAQYVIMAPPSFMDLFRAG